jgi:hypothetical protein
VSPLHIVTDRDVIARLLEESEAPETRLQAAIHWCRAQEIRILQERHHGVLWGMSPLPTWALDPRRDHHTGSKRELAGVSLTGAVLLAYQPRCDRHDEYTAVAGRALQTSMAWMEGVEDAWTQETMSSFWLKGGQGRLYLHGYEEGMRVRESLTLRCPACGYVRLYWDPSCTPCDEKRSLETEQQELFR